VASKIHLAMKCAAAELACERLESAVFTTVCDEIGRLTEGLSTLMTNVRLLA